VVPSHGSTVHGVSMIRSICIYWKFLGWNVITTKDAIFTFQLDYHFGIEEDLFLHSFQIKHLF